MQNTSHLPIYLTDLSISYGQKQCINNFSSTIYYGSKIGIIGRNGSGKSSLLKVLSGIMIPADGSINLSEVVTGYVPQLINNDNVLSGGQRFNHALSDALSVQPNLLLLDEPTNHLDINNRKALMGMLRRYIGTLIIVTHDIELLDNCIDTIWHVANGSVTVFNGKYTDYLKEEEQKWSNLTGKVNQLNKGRKKAHQQLMHEQTRAKNSQQMGKKHIKQRKWPTITSTAKAARSETTSGKNKRLIDKAKQAASAELEEIYIPEVLIPKFNLSTHVSGINKTIINLCNGSCGYGDKLVMSNINLSMNSTEKIVIHGANASGKSTLIRAILDDVEVFKSGDWHCPQPRDIGYLDQHYLQLDPNQTAVELVQEKLPGWRYAEIRDHLNSFLLRKNEEVNIATKHLSGGEKIRLSLALIAAQLPRLLLLDEITNNIDLETRQHMVEVLKDYPGAFILICHDNAFIEQLNLNVHYQIKNGMFYKVSI